MSIFGVYSTINVHVLVVLHAAKLQCPPKELKGHKCDYSANEA